MPRAAQKKTEPVNAAQVAYVLGVSPDTVTNFKRDGIIKPLPNSANRKFDLQEVVAAYVQYKAGTGEGAQTKRNKLLAQQERKLRLQNDERAGLLINTDTAAALFSEFCIRLRGGITALPGRLASTLAGESSAVKIKKVLQDETRQLLDHAEAAFKTLQKSDGAASENTSAGRADT